jgi:NADP-dependent 3-hydroxy acid dehydrogenase YdfG
MGTIEESVPSEWRGVIDINLLGTYYPCRAAIPIMKGQGQGDIVNISSTAGRRSSAFVSAYTASKHAVNAMTEALRREVGPQGIRVCVIEPGATVSEVYESMPDPAQRAFMREHVTKVGAMAAEDVAAAILFAVSLPRRANVTEILMQPTSDVQAR